MTTIAKEDTAMFPICAAKLLKAAADLGTKHGRNAAEWYAQDAFGGRCTRNHKENALRVLDAIEDSSIWEGVNVPNLSGEFADDLTPRTLALRLCEETGTDHDSVPPETEDEMCEAYECAVVTAFADKLCDMARACVED